MTDLAIQLPEANRRLDAIDRKILTVLQEDASLSVAEIGDRVGLSSTPCWKRIQRLEADGVILRRVALVDQNKIGLGISVFVSVESADHSETWLKTFASAVSAMPEVMEFYRMAGDVDYMLRAAEERHLALCDGEDQVGDGAAGAGGVSARLPRINSAVIVCLVRNCTLGRTIQHSRDASDSTDTPRRTGSPAFAGDDDQMWSERRRPSNLLIIRADFRMRAQHGIHRLEHVAHALFGNRALDHDHQFGLVR
jgi:Lrp/AsnC family transcriptional regulator